MITFEDALKKAKELKPSIDTCTEFENGYVFGCKADDDFTGGSHSPCVILKENGKAITMPYFVIHGTGDEIREFDL